MKRKFVLGLFAALMVAGVKKTVDAALLSPISPPSTGVRFMVQPAVSHRLAPRARPTHQSIEQKLRDELDLLALLGSQA